MQLAVDTPRSSLLLRRCSGRFLRMDSKMCLSLTAALYFKKELNLKQANKFLLAPCACCFPVCLQNRSPGLSSMGDKSKKALFFPSRKNEF